MQVTSPGAAAAWDTPTIEPILPPSVNAYDPGNPDNGGTLDSSPQQQDSSASYYDTAEPQPLPQGPAPGFEILYTKPLLVDPATGEALELVHTKPLQISLDGSGPVDYGVNKPLQIDGAPHFDIGYNKPLLMDPATGEAAELVHTKPLQIAPESAMQAASPDAANAVAAPKASAMEIAALELLLAEPANQEMIAQFGPPLAPLNTGTDVGSGIQARFGADLGARLTQLQEAQNNVRGQFLKALDEAQQHPGPGVAGSELVQLCSAYGENGGVSEQSLLHVRHPVDAEQTMAASSKANQFVPGARNEWRFVDPAEFAKAYAAGDSPAQKAFASLHGKDPLQFHEAVEQGGGDAGPYFEPAYYTLGESKLVTGSQTVDDNGNSGGWSESTLQKTQLTPEQNRRLINNEYLWFDPVNGWSTDLENNIRPSNSFLDKAIPLVFAGGLTMITAGAFGITAASASSSLGQSMALGAISSASMQLTTGGKLDLGNILRSALTAGVTFGVMDVSGVSGALQSTELATRTLGHLGKAGLQGLLQEATGGKFKDGLTNSLISSVAGEVGKSLDNHIAELSKDGTLNVQEASTLRLMSRAASSAVRVAGSGGDAAGFASDFLGGLMEDANPFAGKAEAGGKTDKADKPKKSENTDTTPGEKPNNEWVQSLGASDVDPNQAQGLKPGSSLQGLRISDDALSGWSDGIGGATHGQSREGLGNAFGGSLAESLQPAAATAYGLGGTGPNTTGLRFPADWSDGLGLSNDVAVYEQFVNAFSNPTQFDGGDGIQLAAGPGYKGMGGTDRLQVSSDISLFEEASALAASSSVSNSRAAQARASQLSSDLYARGAGDVRDTSPAAGLLVNPETGLADFKYTSQVSNSIGASWDGLFSDGGPTASHDDSIKADQGYWASLGGVVGSDLSFADKLNMAWGTTKYYFRNSDEAQGGAQVIGGGLEVAGAISLSATGPGAVLGVPLAFHGGDSIGTGFNRLVGLGRNPTMTYQFVESSTGSSTLARAVDNGIPFLAGVASAGQGLRLAENEVFNNTVYRGLTSQDSAAWNEGLGLSAKAPRGMWNTEQHVLNDGPGLGGARMNNPWIATSRRYDVADEYRRGISGVETGNGVASIYLGKVPAQNQVELWKQLRRTNTVDSLAYHRSIWAQEVSIYQHVPIEAIGEPLSHISVIKPLTYGLVLGGTRLPVNRGNIQ